MTEEFSARTRAANLLRMAQGTLDVLVIGGGIVGAGIARAAANRGFRTALVDRGDFASGTSGKTSRLIHGGLRYLQNYKVGLVRLSIRERDRLLETAPSLVHPLPFVLPAYADRRPGPRRLRVALFLYDILSKKKLPRRAWLGPDAAAEREPRLARPGLAGAGVYYDACADDARFVLAVIRDAARAGAEVANHVDALELIRDANRVRGARVRDRIEGTSFELRSTVVVNATGVWLDRLRHLAQSPTIRPTKGIHIFLPREKVANRHALALTTKRDHRLVFVLPWNDLTLVGTTDTDFQGDPDHVTPDAEDVGYLLDVTNDAFPQANVGPEDVVSAYAGLRPLVRRGNPDRPESDLSREHDVFVDSDGLISVAGGKFTTHHAMAADVMRIVERQLGRIGPTPRSERSLGPPLQPLEDFLELGFDEACGLHLQGRHGTDALRRHLDAPRARTRIVKERPHVWVEVDLAVEEEMALTLADVLVRRLGLFYEARDQAFDIAPEVASRVASLLGWDSQRKAREVDDYRALVRAHQAFRSSEVR